MTSRTKLLLLLAIFALPTLASFVAFYYFPPTTTGNYGTLVSPVIKLPNQHLTRLDGAGGDAREPIRGKWLLLVRAHGECGAIDTSRLHLLRQVRLMLGREQDRVMRVVLCDSSKAPAAAIQTEFAGTVWISTAGSGWADLLPGGATSKEARIYVVDPLGNVFLFYGATPDVKLMLKDLKQVLRASQIG